MQSFVKHLTYIILIYSLILVVLGVCDRGVVSAAINQEINYQGKLTDSSGVAVADGNNCLKFRLMDSASGGVLNGNILTWTIPSLAAGQSGAVSFKTQVE